MNFHGFREWLYEAKTPGHDYKLKKLNTHHPDGHGSTHPDGVQHTYMILHKKTNHYIGSVEHSGDEGTMVSVGKHEHHIPSEHSDKAPGNSLHSKVTHVVNHHLSTHPEAKSEVGEQMKKEPLPKTKLPRKAHGGDTTYVNKDGATSFKKR
jgi:hypothetical protein